MEERDYFKKQIDLIGKVLGKLLADLIGAKSSEGLKGGIEITNQILKDELDLDIDFLIAVPRDKIIDFLKIEKGLSDENLESIAEILIVNLRNSDNNIEEINRTNLYEKCLKIYEHIEKSDKTYSFERNTKIQNIRSLLF
jgi:hypothetical protein